MFQALNTEGKGDEDHSAIVNFIEAFEPKANALLWSRVTSDIASTAGPRLDIKRLAGVKSFFFN